MASPPRSRLWRRLDSSRVECLVCERRCEICAGSVGVCGNYLNRGGELVHLGYGRLSAVESRPIEIKPLFHYWPNSTALTYSSYGCNFYCPWCQNHHLSFRKPSLSDPVVSPSELVELALLYGDEGISASFNEPTVNFDYVVDATVEAVERGLYSMVVTNGYLTTEAVKTLVEAGVDGWSIDIKGCPGMRRALVTVDHNIVFRNARLVIDMGGHVEMVYLVVTRTNDFDECIDWILSNHLDKLGPDVPLHVNRYYPARVWREPPTPVSKLLEIREKARRMGVSYVYVGNVGDSRLESTFCPRCGKTLIERRGYRVTSFTLERGAGGEWRCPRCGLEVPIRGEYVAWK